MLHTFLRGIALGAGLLIGAMGSLILLVRILRRSRPAEYKVDELLKAFLRFREQAVAEQQYELLARLQTIIEDLQNGKSYMPAKEDAFTIKSNTEFILRTLEGEQESALRMVTRYTIESKK